MHPPLDSVMNRIHSIALFAGVFAVAMGTLGITGFSGVSAMPLMTEAIPQTQDRAGILGHVTYTLFDADNNIKQYVQGDNVVVEVGRNCIASHIFQSTLDGVKCNGATGDFNFIAIGNVTTASSANTDIQLDFEGTSTCAVTGDASDGEMARVGITLVEGDIVNATGSTGTKVTLETLGDETFTFDASNATTVTQSGLFDAQVATVAANGACGTLGTPGVNGNMFAIQTIAGIKSKRFITKSFKGDFGSRRASSINNISFY